MKKQSIRIILKNGTEISFKCDGMDVEYDKRTGKLVSYNAKGCEESIPFFIDVSEISAVVRMLSEESEGQP